MPRRLALQAPGDAAEFFQSCDNGFQRHVQHNRGGSCRQCVTGIVRTGHLQIGAEISRWGMCVQVQAGILRLPLAGHVGLPGQAEFE